MELLNKILPLTKVLGVSIVLNEGRIEKCAFCLLESKKGSVSIIEHKELRNVKDLLFEKEIPIVLNISGESILTKRFMNQKIEIEDAIENILPGVEKDDFLAQVYNKDSSFCSTIRKDEINKIFEELGEFKNNLISLSLNRISVVNTIELISNKEQLTFCNQSFHFENESLLDIEFTNKEETDYSVDGITLSSEEFSAFSVAYQFYLSKDNEILVDDFLEEEKEDFIHRRLFEKSKIIIPVFFMIILLINFLYFSSANKKNNFLQNNYQKNQSLIQELDSLKKEVQLKSSFLNEEQWFSNSKSSFYGDRLVATLPNEINLEEINIFPLIDDEKNSSLIYNKNVIEVSGQASKAQVFNEWIKSLKENTWLIDFEIRDLNQKSNKERVDFKIVINLNEDNV